MDNPVPPRRWETVSGGGGSGGGGEAARGEGSPRASKDTVESIGRSEGDTIEGLGGLSGASDSCGGGVSLGDFDDDYYAGDSDDDGDDERIFSRLAWQQLREANVLLKDTAGRLEAEVSKLRNIIAAMHGMQKNGPQRTRFSLSSLHPTGLSTHFETRFSVDQSAEVMSDNGTTNKKNKRIAPPPRRNWPPPSTSVAPLPPPESAPSVSSGLLFVSRLSFSLDSFVRDVDEQERRIRCVKVAAFAAMRKEIVALWPRATIALYGSFVTTLSLPSSDLDVVISLPKVQHEAPAAEPGDLEGRNAIKETWQSSLSRKLHTASWVEPSSVRGGAGACRGVCQSHLSHRGCLAGQNYQQHRRADNENANHVVWGSF